MAAQRRTPRMAEHRFTFAWSRTWPNHLQDFVPRDGDLQHRPGLQDHGHAGALEMEHDRLARQSRAVLGLPFPSARVRPKTYVTLVAGGCDEKALVSRDGHNLGGGFCHAAGRRANVRAETRTSAGERRRQRRLLPSICAAARASVLPVLWQLRLLSALLSRLLQALLSRLPPALLSALLSRVLPALL